MGSQLQCYNVPLVYLNDYRLGKILIPPVWQKPHRLLDWKENSDPLLLLFISCVPPLLLSTREQWIILGTRASCHEHPWIRDSTIISLLYVLKSCSLMKNTCHLRLKLIPQIEGTQLKTDVWTEGLYYDGPIVNDVLSTSLGIMLLKFFIRSLVLTKHLRIQNRTLQHFEKPNGIRTR